MALRLPADARDAFLKKYKTKLCEQHGTVLKEYVEIPDALFAKTAELKKSFDTSYAYVASLAPKRRKRNRKRRHCRHCRKQHAGLRIPSPYP